MLVAGESPPDPPDADLADLDVDSQPSSKGRENLRASPKLGIADRYLDEFPGFGRVILLTRFDLAAKKHDVRYINIDLGRSYRVLTDDLPVFDEVPIKDRERTIRESQVGLERYQELFSSAAALIYLPLAFVTDPAFVRKMEFTTKLASKKSENQVKRAVKELGTDDCVFTRDINCLATATRTQVDAESRFMPPDLEFRSEGFWKPIPQGEIGEDQDGNPIVGMSWVTRTDSWSTKSPSSFLLERAAGAECGPDPGILYVIRSGAHEIDVYKIGLTRRSADVRAAELGTATGVPLPFGVLASWKVGDCGAVEREVHLMLATRRINPRREFFRASLKEIISTIQHVIADLGTG
jgi:hypothetical protein